MSFRQSFESNVNRNMQEDAEQAHHTEVSDIKTQLETKEPAYEEEDYELAEKKDRPPRFSTLFTGAPQPQIVERYIESPHKKKKGVVIPLPLLIILAIVLFFETTLLFAYTIIALDNNLGKGLFPIGSTRTGNCAQGQSINVAPKFFMGSAQSGAALPDSAPTPVTSTTTSSSTTTKPTEFGKTETTKVVVVTPPPAPAVSSTLVLTVDENGVTHTPTPTSTADAKAKKRASISSNLKSILSANMPSDGDEAPAPTTFVTSKTANGDAKATSSAAGGGGPCFGGAGAVGLVCPDGVGTEN